MFQGSCEVALTLVTERGSARHPIRLGRTQCSVSTPSTRAQKFSTLRLRDARQSSRNPAPTASPRSHTRKASNDLSESFPSTLSHRR